MLRPPGPIDLRDLTNVVNEVTGERWTIELSDEAGEASLFEQQQAARQAQDDAIRATPIVAAVIEAFPGATLVEPEQEQNWSERR